MSRECCSTCHHHEAPIRVLISGAAGQIGYSLAYMVASGYVFGDKQPIIMHMLEVPAAMTSLKGLCMELQDSYLPLVHGVVPTDQLDVAFKDIDAAFLVGSMPRKAGMERRDLLGANVKIFKEQGTALNKYAKKDVKVIVVGNPANTNAFICSKFAPSIPVENITSMSRLDQNRCYGIAAEKLGVNVDAIKKAVVWGNHSGTMFPDMSNATVDIGCKKNESVAKALGGTDWLRGEFVTIIQKRGAAIITARKLSSALSAAKAACDHMRDWWQGAPEDKWVCMSVCSDGSYGIDKGLFFSFPCTVKDKKWSIVKGIKFDEWSQSMLEKTKDELIEERDVALQTLS